MRLRVRKISERGDSEYEHSGRICMRRNVQLLRCRVESCQFAWLWVSEFWPKSRKYALGGLGAHIFQEPWLCILVSIYSLQNSHEKRRQMIWERTVAKNPSFKIMFVESLCDDQAMLEENFKSKGGVVAVLKNPIGPWKIPCEMTRALSFTKVYSALWYLFWNSTCPHLHKGIFSFGTSWMT